MKKNKLIYDTEELDLLDEIENQEWVDVPLGKKEKERYAQSAAYTKSLQEKNKPLSVLL